MVEPEEDERESRELEWDDPGIPFSFFTLVVENVDLVLVFVVEKHEGESSEIPNDRGSDVDQAALANERPWRMADSEENRLGICQLEPLLLLWHSSGPAYMILGLTTRVKWEHVAQQRGARRWCRHGEGLQGGEQRD